MQFVEPFGFLKKSLFAAKLSKSFLRRRKDLPALGRRRLKDKRQKKEERRGGKNTWEKRFSNCGMTLIRGRVFSFSEAPKEGQACWCCEGLKTALLWIIMMPILPVTFHCYLRIFCCHLKRTKFRAQGRFDRCGAV